MTITNSHDPGDVRQDIDRYLTKLGDVGATEWWLLLVRARKALEAAPSPHPELTVWFGALPESNGKQNWSAILHRKGAGIWDGITFERTEFSDRARYEADRLRYLIGETDEPPDILAYDPDAKEIAASATVEDGERAAFQAEFNKLGYRWSDSNQAKAFLGWRLRAIQVSELQKRIGECEGALEVQTKVYDGVPGSLARDDGRALALLREARNALFMWRDVAPAVSLINDIDKFLGAAPSLDGKAVQAEAPSGCEHSWQLRTDVDIPYRECTRCGVREFVDLCEPAATQPTASNAEERDEDDQYTLDRACDLLEHYASFINRVKPDEIEEHPYLPELEMVAADLRAFAALASKPQAVPWDDAKQAELNDWFLSLPKGRQGVLLEDKWLLAGAAFQAGKASMPPAGEQKAVGMVRLGTDPWNAGCSVVDLNAPLTVGTLIYASTQPEQVAQDKMTARDCPNCKHSDSWGIPDKACLITCVPTASGKGSKFSPLNAARASGEKGAS